MQAIEIIVAGIKNNHLQISNSKFKVLTHGISTFLKKIKNQKILTSKNS
jgi:hypothetical protein